MVRIIDVKSRAVICSDALMCASMWRKARGLMLSRRKNLVFVLWHPSRVSLHMIFVFFPIDVVGLDESMRVVCLARLEPFRFWRAPVKVKYIVELSKRPYKVPSIGSRLSF